MKILAVGDSFMPARYFREAFGLFEASHDVRYVEVDDSRPFTPTTPSELALREYLGSPAEVAEQMEGVEVLVVQGAPITDAVLDASPELRLVGCARGGPVNVDVGAITARGLTLVNTPGKNAEAVADMTLAFLVMLARGFPKAQRFLADGNQLKDNWEGVRFIGNDLRRHVLGLVGYGKVGHLVAMRALAFGMAVLVFDPFVEIPAHPGVKQVDSLNFLLANADFVSLHARATGDNANMIDAKALAAMQDGAYLVNTARETLVDEDALDAALASGRLAGAALDVVHVMAKPERHRLLRHDNVVLTPHIGGATHEGLFEGAEMLAAEISRFADGQPLVHVVNRDTVGV